MFAKRVETLPMWRDSVNSGSVAADITVNCNELHSRIMESIVFVGTVVSSDPAITCMLDDDDTSDELGRCLRMGSDYVEGYLNSMKPGKKKKDFDRCG